MGVALSANLKLNPLTLDRNPPLKALVAKATPTFPTPSGPWLFSNLFLNISNQEYIKNIF